MITDTHPRSFSSGLFARYLDALEIAPPQTHAALTLWPLIDASGSLGGSPGNPFERVLPYVALADAIEGGTFRISEVDASGSVPHVVADNGGELAVLVLFGEELRGAKQNRIANATFLVGPRSLAVLDVSCVEVGRWASRGDTFSACGSVFSSEGRSRMAKRVAQARDAGRGFEADQHAVWHDVDSKLRRSGVASATRAYADHLRARAPEIEAGQHAFDLVDEQVGFVAAVRDRVVGLEVVGRPEVFARTFRGLLGSYWIDALDGPGPGRGRRRRMDDASADRDTSTRIARTHFDEPRSFLGAVGRAPAKASRSIGIGEDVRIRGLGVVGCVSFAGAVVHVTAFPEPDSRV